MPTPPGNKTAVIGIFFLGSVQIFLVGLLGEYIGAALTQVRTRPLVVEGERVGDFTSRLQPITRSD